MLLRMPAGELGRDPASRGQSRRIVCATHSQLTCWSPVPVCGVMEGDCAHGFAPLTICSRKFGLMVAPTYTIVMDWLSSSSLAK
jgi:hypothetical protein